MSNADDFLQLYKKLEVLCQTKYNYPNDGKAITRLSERREFGGIKDKIKYCKEVRALLQHNPKIDSTYLVEPSATMLKILNDVICKVSNPPKVIDYAITLEKIVYASLKDYVLPFMEKMINCNYTHIPILNDGKVLGAFSENTIFMIMSKDHIMELNSKTTFEQIQEYLPLDQHKTEVFEFLNKDCLLCDAEKLFLQDFRKNQKLSMLFITQNKKQEERLLGIITPWDIIGCDI